MVESIVSGIADVLKNAIYGIFEMIFWLISLMVKVFLFPIDLLLSNVFPNFTEYMNHLNESLNLLVTAPFNYFWNILPPITRFVLAGWLTILIMYYSVIWTYRGIIFVPKIIRKIKFW